MMSQISHFRTVLIMAAIFSLFVIGAHAEPATPTGILDEVFARTGVPSDTQEQVSRVIGEFVGDRPTAYQVLITTLHDLMTVYEALATALAASDMPDLQRQMIQGRLDANQTLITVLEKRMSLIHDSTWPVRMDEACDYRACSAPKQWR